MKIYFKTFGCRTNIYDTELMKKYAGAISVDNEEEADLIVVNSCSVTNGADSDTRAFIRHIKRLGKRVFLTGCGALSQGQNLLNQNLVDGVFTPSRKSEISKFITKEQKFFETGDINFKENEILSSFENHSKAFIKIQEGCDFACSYCIIPQLRGKSRSIDENLILQEADNLAKNGFNEIILTGTNIGSYGKSENSSLGKLLLKLGKINGIKLIRLGSIEPSQIDESFKEILDEPWLEKHLHIALQHTSQKMLTIMRRRNKALKDLELFLELSQKGFALGTDFIVGHPGESEEIWEEAVENFKKFPLTHIHAFVYSPRKNTHSATLKQEVDGLKAKQRLKILKNITMLNNYNFRLKKEKLFVNIERKNGEFYEGFDQFYNKNYIKTDKFIDKKIVEVKDYEVKLEANFAEI